MSHWTGTLDLIRTTLSASAAWTAATSPAAPADRIVVGVGGHPWDGVFLTVSASKPLALPVAQIGLGNPQWQPSGHRRWERQGSATLDVAMAGGATPTGYRAAVQLAEDLMNAYRAASDAGTLILSDIEVSGPPLLMPASAPSPFAGAWVFQLTISWDMNK